MLGDESPNRGGVKEKPGNQRRTRREQLAVIEVTRAETACARDLSALIGTAYGGARLRRALERHSDIVKKLIAQLMKFGVVGVIAFIIDYGLLALLTEAFGVNYLVSATI